MFRKFLLSTAALAALSIPASAAQIAAGSGNRDVVPLQNPAVLGHLSGQVDGSAGALPPVVSGAGCSATAGYDQSDLAGNVTASGAATCVITFSKAFYAKPNCVATPTVFTATTLLADASATALTVGVGAATHFSYLCTGR